MWLSQCQNDGIAIPPIVHLRPTPRPFLPPPPMRLRGGADGSAVEVMDAAGDQRGGVQRQAIGERAAKTYATFFPRSKLPVDSCVT